MGIRNMIESGFIRSLRSKLPPSLYSLKISDRFTAGVPDLYLAAAGGKSLWVEVKYEKVAPVRSHKPHLSANQDAWLSRHHALGHSVCVVVGSPAGAMLFPPITWQTTQEWVPISLKCVVASIMKLLLHETEDPCES